MDEPTIATKPNRRPFLWAAVAILLLLLANEMIRLPYFVLAPGGASPLNSAITIPPDKRFAPNGELLFTTVSLIEAHPFDIVRSQFDSNDEIVPRKRVVGNATTQQYTEANQLSMEDSKQTATAVAMRRAGFVANQTGDGAEIKQVSPGSPAEGKLAPGEVIVRINTTPVTFGDQVGSAVRTMPAGADVSLDLVKPDGSKRTADLKTAARPDEPNSSYLGVSIQTKNPRLDTPFPVNVDLGKVGGPSAGLAMTTALLDELTPGQLTGGKDIAATGTIDLDGTVGVVGGVKQKVAAVRDGSKAKLFLVPKVEEAEARANAGDGLTVVGVGTLEEALEVIAANGGDRSGIPNVPPQQ